MTLNFQPALCFPASVDNVVVHDQRDSFRTTICRFKPLQQADEQRRTFAVAAHIADFARSAAQRSGQIIFFIKDLMLCAAFVQCFVDCRHLFIFMRVTDRQGWRSPSPHKPRRRQLAANGSGM